MKTESCPEPVPFHISMRVGFFFFFSHDYLSTRPSFTGIGRVLGAGVEQLYLFFFFSIRGQRVKEVEDTRQCQGQAVTRRPPSEG